jgi:hypothetical protein
VMVRQPSLAPGGGAITGAGPPAVVLPQPSPAPGGGAITGAGPPAVVLPQPSPAPYRVQEPEHSGGAWLAGHQLIRKTGWSGAIASNLSSGESGPTPWKNTPTSNFHFLR